MRHLRESLIRKRLGAFLAISLLVVACNSAGGSSNPNSGETLVAAVASFDVVADRPTRFMVGLYSVDLVHTLAYGNVSFSFVYLGTGDGSSYELGSVGPVDASFLPIPGQDVDLDTPGPQFVSRSEATGVYGAADVTFDRAGFWEVIIEATVDGSIRGSGRFGHPCAR